ncbi:hypothetical protein S7711_10595 [Stachybotrys chartarum IBT 7711]|uniref:Uncharacterized protein n=1 Tax=Stachybotrys chartarum (strain CBS 109288 / IBT 7711) TaxID=1280523 RepID=A0A084B8Z8_STACB|nr:hypothetical protein S7711_10595 [Stachybotrys chartarum IBT 7711]KFA56299.1 hypothetical protein S40293_10366 [Stachybotrys chartarum IBT 40293]
MKTRWYLLWPSGRMSGREPEGGEGRGKARTSIMPGRQKQAPRGFIPPSGLIADGTTPLIQRRSARRWETITAVTSNQQPIHRTLLAIAGPVVIRPSGYPDPASMIPIPMLRLDRNPDPPFSPSRLTWKTQINAASPTVSLSAWPGGEHNEKTKAGILTPFVETPSHTDRSPSCRHFVNRQHAQFDNAASLLSRRHSIFGNAAPRVDLNGACIHAPNTSSAAEHIGERPVFTLLRENYADMSKRIDRIALFPSIAVCGTVSNISQVTCFFK